MITGGCGPMLISSKVMYLTKIRLCFIEGQWHALWVPTAEYHPSCCPSFAALADTPEAAWNLVNAEATHFILRMRWNPPRHLNGRYRTKEIILKELRGG